MPTGIPCGAWVCGCPRESLALQGFREYTGIPCTAWGSCPTLALQGFHTLDGKPLRCKGFVVLMLCGYGRYVSGKVRCPRSPDSLALCVARDREHPPVECVSCGADPAALLRDLVWEISAERRLDAALEAKLLVAVSRMPEPIPDAWLDWLGHLSASELDRLRELGDAEDAW